MRAAVSRGGRVVLAVGLAALLLLAVACPGGEESGLVQGLVLEVVDRSPSEIETLRIKDDDGRVWTFTTEKALLKDGAHLRVHQVLGHPVVVLYVTKDGTLVATEIRD